MKYGSRSKTSRVVLKPRSFSLLPEHSSVSPNLDVSNATPPLPIEKVSIIVSRKGFIRKWRAYFLIILLRSDQVGGITNNENDQCPKDENKSVAKAHLLRPKKSDDPLTSFDSSAVKVGSLSPRSALNVAG